MTTKPPNERRVDSLAGWVSVALVIVVLLSLLVMRTFWPDNVVFIWLWRSVFAILLPVLLVLGFRLAVRGKNVTKK